LSQARKRYELVLFPCERHSPHKLQDKIYIEDIMHDFFVTNLHPSVLPHSSGSVYSSVVHGVQTAVHAPLKMMSSL
jgi:hypothetical protein